MIKVLIVDDSKADLSITCKMLLRDNKIKVFFTHDPSRAVKLAIQNNPDVVLLDIMMPKVDGLQVRKQLLENEKTKNISVIFLTSSIDEETMSIAKDSGCLTCMQKPASAERLINNIKASRAITYIKTALESIQDSRRVLY